MKKLLLTAAATVLLTATGAGMAMADPGNDNHYNWMDRNHHDNGLHRGDRNHDRYWQPEYREGRYVDRDRVFVTLRAHHYNRFIGDPYWYQGRYVVRSYDRFGHVVFVEVNPYTGGFIGVVRF
jgi:hypothetical protein